MKLYSNHNVIRSNIMIYIRIPIFALSELMKLIEFE